MSSELDKRMQQQGKFPIGIYANSSKQVLQSATTNNIKLVLHGRRIVDYGKLENDLDPFRIYTL